MNALESLRWYYHESMAEIGYRSTLGGQVDALHRGTTSVDYVTGTDDLASQLVPGWLSPQPMSQRAMAAVRRRSVVHAALLRLSDEHRAVIECGYRTAKGYRTIRVSHEDEKTGQQRTEVSAAFDPSVAIVDRVSSVNEQRHDQSLWAVRHAKDHLEANPIPEGWTVSAMAWPAFKRLAVAKAELRASATELAEGEGWAIALLRDAHDAFRDARRSVKDEIRERVQAARDAGRHRRAAREEEILRGNVKPTARARSEQESWGEVTT